MRVLGNEGGCGFNIVLGDISLTPPMSRRRPGVMPFSQTVTDCQPFGASQEAVLVSTICQEHKCCVSALRWSRGETGSSGEKLSSFFLLSLSLSSVTDAREGIFPSGYSAGEGCPGERCICLESVTQAKQRQLPRGQNEFIHAVNPTVPPALLSGADTLHTDTHIRAHTSMSVWVSEG